MSPALRQWLLTLTHSVDKMRHKLMTLQDHMNAFNFALSMSFLMIEYSFCFSNTRRVVQQNERIKCRVPNVKEN